MIVIVHSLGKLLGSRRVRLALKTKPAGHHFRRQCDGDGPADEICGVRWLWGGWLIPLFVVEKVRYWRLLKFQA